jgi:hypothetical protein
VGFVGSTGPVTVVVVDNQVVRARDASGTEVSTSGWLTIDALFDQAAQAMSDNQLNHIEFDEDSGYPTLVDTGDWALDGGMRLTIYNLRPPITVALEN